MAAPLKIYHVAGTRSVRVIWACIELGVPYNAEVIDFGKEFRNSPEWLNINPVGKVRPHVGYELATRSCHACC